MMFGRISDCLRGSCPRQRCFNTKCTNVDGIWEPLWGYWRLVPVQRQIKIVSMIAGTSDQRNPGLLLVYTTKANFEDLAMRSHSLLS